LSFIACKYPAGDRPLESHGKALPHYAGEFEARGYRYGKDFILPDAHVRELGTGKTRVETLASPGRKIALVAGCKVVRAPCGFPPRSVVPARLNSYILYDCRFFLFGSLFACSTWAVLALSPRYRHLS
jgi:hypothetical protein